MLKSQTILLPGQRDPATLTELPALVADRAARAALQAIGAPVDGGVMALAMQHADEILARPDVAMDLLQPFVQIDRTPRSWRAVLAAQRAALALHVGFIVGRPRLDVPVAMQAHAIQHGSPDLQVTFCSPQIATVLHSGRATYRELETVLSTEDVYNLVELLNVEAVREWHANQSTGPRT